MKGWTILPRTGLLNQVKYNKGLNVQTYPAYEFAGRDLFVFIERGPLFAEVETPAGATIHKKQYKGTVWFVTDKLIVHEFHKPTYGLLKHLLSLGADPQAGNCALISFLAQKNQIELLEYIFQKKQYTFFRLGDHFHLALTHPSVRPETLEVLLKYLPLDDVILDRVVDRLSRAGNTEGLALVQKYAPPGYRPKATNRQEPVLMFR